MTKTVAIIGAGIVGVSTAIWLQRDGHKVVLIDKVGPAGGASHGNGGILASCSVVPVTTPGLLRKAPGMLLSPNQPLFLKWRYLPRLLPWLVKYLRHANADDTARIARALTPIIGDSLADHQALAQGTEAEKYIVPSDYLYLYEDRKAFEKDSFGWSLRRENGFDWDELEGPALAEYDPIFAPEIGFAARFGGHGRITDPGAYVQALADHAQAQGADLLIAEADEILRSADRVTGVRCGNRVINADAVLVSTGAWSSPLARQLGVKIPLEAERGYHLELWNPSVMPRAPVMIASGKFVATPMDGRLRIAGTVEFGGLDAPASRAAITLLRKGVTAAIPGLTWEREVEWLGHRPAITDSIPVIAESPTVGGGFLGFGHHHVGLTGGPKTGRLLAQLISGRTPNLDMSPYSAARFGQ